VTAAVEQSSDVDQVTGCLLLKCLCLSVNSEARKPSSSVTSDVLTSVPHTELYAVLDTGQTKRPKTLLPVSGPELAARLKIGTRVVRGVDWKWGDQVQFWFCLEWNTYLLLPPFVNR